MKESKPANPAPVRMFDSHMHTPLCRHAIGEPEEYAERAAARGLAGIIVTCHSPMPDGWFGGVRMAPEELTDYFARVERAARAFAGRVEVRLGMESDYFPGMEPWLRELHGRAPFDYILGSIHYFGNEYVERFGKGGDAEFLAAYFRNLVASAESGLFDCLAHPDLIKNHFGNRWRFEEAEPLIAVALDRIARTGVAMELNTSGMIKTIAEMNPGPRMLRMMADRKIPVVIGSDSHMPTRVGDRFEDALDLLEKAGYRTVSVFEKRKRTELPIPAARASLRRV
jgi:histidinol-phosphatase (PHP family)